MKKWLSEVPKNCEVCGEKFGDYFFDSRTPNGQWGLICEKCQKNFGYGTGIGKAQKYITKTKVGVDGFDEC